MSITLDATKIKQYLEGTTVLAAADNAVASEAHITWQGNTAAVVIQYGNMAGTVFTPSAWIQPLTISINLTTGAYDTPTGTVTGTLTTAQLAALVTQINLFRDMAEQTVVQFGLTGTQVPY